MLKKHRASGFDVLVINTWPEGTDDARKLVRNLGYSFRLLHVPEGWKHSMGQGANFLIDQQGRVVESLHFRSSEDLRIAERLVKGCLRHGTARSKAVGQPQLNVAE